MSSLRDLAIGLALSAAVGLIGAIPFAMLALIFGGTQAASDIYLLQAIILGAWLPLKFVIDRQVKGQSDLRIPRFSLVKVSLFVVFLGIVLITPVLYFTTFTAFLVGALVYGLAGAPIALAIIIALLVQAANSYRASRREKQMGVRNNIFVRMQDFSSANINIQIDPDQVQRQTPRQETPPTLYLPEDNLQDPAERRTTQDEPMTINIDPDSVAEQSDDET